MREKLPMRREREVVEVDHVWAPATEQQVTERLTLSIGRYADERIGEVFVDYVQQQGERRKSENAVNLAHDIATLISIALQHGASVEELRDPTGHAEINFMGNARSMPHSIAGTVLDALVNESSRPEVRVS